MLPTPVPTAPARRAFLFALVICLAALGAATPPPVQAAPPAPTLISTNPASPSTSLTPRIIGNADGVITRRLARPAARAPSPPPQVVSVQIYITPDCSGAPTAAGTLAEFQGAGIQVTVAPDSITTFYGESTDSAAENSPCSSPGLTYQQVTTGPGPPDVLSVSPASPANDNQPSVTGSAAVGSTVSLFKNAGCAGTGIGSGSAAAFALGGIKATVPDDSTTTVYAMATLAGLNSACSSTFVTYREDSTGPPAPALHTVPGARANHNTPLVTGSAPGATVVKIFDNASCKETPLVTGTPAELGSGFPVSVADNTTTDFFGLSRDAVGNPSACSAVPATYTEDSLAPRTRITLGPGAKTRKRSPVVRFTDATANPGTTFRCKIDKRGWRSCRAPIRLRRLRYGRHIFRVKAIDAAGNREAVGAKLRFKRMRPPRAGRHH